MKKFVRHPIIVIALVLLIFWSISSCNFGLQPVNSLQNSVFFVKWTEVDNVSGYQLIIEDQHNKRYEYLTRHNYVLLDISFANCKFYVRPYINSSNGVVYGTYLPIDAPEKL